MVSFTKPLQFIAIIVPTLYVTTARGLQQASNTGNVAACYSAMHSEAYPLHEERFSTNDLQGSISQDFQIMSQHFTHVRTFYSQFMNVEVAPYAAQHGVKLYLGVYMTKENWQQNEIDAAVNAVKKFPGIVEAVLVGNENLIDGKVKADDILSIVGQIKQKLGGAANGVKFGTVQRITEYMDPRFDDETKKLSNNLDILGVNIYPFFDNGYDRANPTKLLDILWNQMAGKFPVEKMRLTETGYSTGGSPSPVAPRVVPGLDASAEYYEALVNWTPKGNSNTPKFWFQVFDRRPDDKTMQDDVEKHFGFFTHDYKPKKENFPRELAGGNNSVPEVPVEPTQGPAPVTPTPGPGPVNPPAPFNPTEAPVGTQTPVVTEAPSSGSPSVVPVIVPTPAPSKACY